MVLTDHPDNKKAPVNGGFFEVVGAARFELTTSCSQSRRSTRLSYAPRPDAEHAYPPPQIKHFFTGYENTVIQPRFLSLGAKSA